MGKTLALLAPQRGFEVRLVMDLDVNAKSHGITREKFKDVDVCIDFTTPDAVVENVHRVAALGVNLVVGTTGCRNTRQRFARWWSRRALAWCTLQTFPSA